MTTGGRIAVRGYQASEWRPLWNPEPSNFDTTLTFDTETELTPAQRLRVGCYIYRTEFTENVGLFYDSSILKPKEIATLQAYAETHRYNLQTILGFQRFLVRTAREENTAIVGFNLPFDFSRVASEWMNSRGKFTDGFTFKLGHTDTSVMVKHLSARKAFYRWSTFSKKKPCKAAIVDVMTLGAALTGRSHSLASLARSLETESQKGSGEHGKTLTSEYLDYLVSDVQTTQDCFDVLRDRYLSYGLSTPIEAIYSEASLGKAYLRSFGIVPNRHIQDNFPDDLTGKLISTYYGGRAEVHIRREIVPVCYTDFLSMYPTVCAKMSLWSFVIASKTLWHRSLVDTRLLLKKANRDGPEILCDDSLWPQLTTIVQMLPNDDILPVRAQYAHGTYNIGLNYLTSAEPIWYTLADVLASVFLTGKVPTIVDAVTFTPGKPQEKLQTLSLMGNEELKVNPYSDDFYRRLIELRKASTNPDESQALKIIANSTCYGIFVELTRDTIEPPSDQTFYAHNGMRRTRTPYIEKPGAFFHPLLATSITGAARLLLAVAEKLGDDRGLDWALCDTDSVAFTGPNLNEKVGEIVDFFSKLNPYKFRGSILKVERINEKAELFGFAVSTKRYCLFNRSRTQTDSVFRPINNRSDLGTVIIRKASAHGLGYLKRPYGKGNTDTGAPEWINDLWQAVIESADSVSGLDLSTLPMMKLPAMSQVTLNTANLYRMLAGYNQKVKDVDQIRPFGFIGSYQHPSCTALSPLSVKPQDSARHIFNRDTLEPLHREDCRTYADVLELFDRHPEAKFLGGTLDGTLSRRHIEVTEIDVIGKESNRVDPEQVNETGFTVERMMERKGRIIVREVEE